MIWTCSGVSGAAVTELGAQATKYVEAALDVVKEFSTGRDKVVDARWWRSDEEPTA